MNAFLANLYLRAIAVRDREEGQAMAEYGIILALIAVVVIATVKLLGTQIEAAFTTITSNL
jgi:pilus assembly protein Flp/PilA